MKYPVDWPDAPLVRGRRPPGSRLCRSAHTFARQVNVLTVRCWYGGSPAANQQAKERTLATSTYNSSGPSGRCTNPTLEGSDHDDWGPDVMVVSGGPRDPRDFTAIVGVAPPRLALTADLPSRRSGAPRLQRATRSARTTTARRTASAKRAAASGRDDDGGGEPPGDPALDAEGRATGGASHDPGLDDIEKQRLYREVAQQARRRSRYTREMRGTRRWRS